MRTQAWLRPSSHSILTVLLLLSALAATGASAQTGPSGGGGHRAGALRLGLESTVLATESLTVSFDGSGLGGIGGVGEVDASSTTVGISQLAGIGPLIGYAVSDRIMLSGRVTLATSAASNAGLDADLQFRFSLVPAIEFMLADPGATLVPFVGAALAFTVAEVPMGSMALSEVSFGLGAQGGVHLFLSDTVSFDPGLLVMYRLGSASARSGLLGPAVDASISGFGVLLTAGISVWP